MYHSRHFTLAQANTTLGQIKPLVEEMVQLKNELDSEGFDIYRHEFFGGPGSNGTGKYPEKLNRLVEIVRIISSKGVIIKSLDEGLVDFPHIRRGGEEVYLCWKSGEDSIAYWHRIPDGYAGRKSIEEL